MDELLKQLRADREKMRRRLDELGAIPTGAEARAFTDEERSELRTLAADATSVGSIAELDARIADLDALVAREATADAARAAAGAAAPAAGGATVTGEARTYRKGGTASYFRDLYKAGKGDIAAAERMHRHVREVEVEARSNPDGFEARALSRTDGQGGNFVPPAFLIADYAEFPRAGRPFAREVNDHELLGGTDTIKLPKVTTGTSVTSQTADNQNVAEVDLVDTEVSSSVYTIAGQQGVALQLLEQSPIGFDEVIWADLMSEYDVEVDRQVVFGSGTGGKHTGVLTTAGVNAVTYTSATPTAQALYSKIADAIQRIHTARKRPPTHIYMSPRRWAFFLAAVDANGRPLVVPNGVAFNPQGTQSGVESFGPVGTLQGLPVFTDPNMPENLGAGTNEDRIVIARMEDLHLWEGTLNARALEQIRGDKLQVLLQVYAYSAFMPQRYPTAISVISGTGLVTPTF
jgi:HK97 family phage major capsid protein